MVSTSVVSHWDAINWRLVGDKTLRCKCDISTIFSCSLTDNCTHDKYATVARISHDTLTTLAGTIGEFWPPLARSSRTCREPVARQSCDIRETLVRNSHEEIAIICHFQPILDVLATVARTSHDRRTTVVQMSHDAYARK